MDCVAVGWLVWVTLLLVGGAVFWSVYVVVAIGWQLWVIVQADVQFWVRAVGWPWLGSVLGVGGVCRWHWLACVGCVCWFLVGVRFGLRRDLCEGSTLAVQDLVCDGSRRVAAEGGAVGVVSSGCWGCMLGVGLCGWFGFCRQASALLWREVVGWCW